MKNYLILLIIYIISEICYSSSDIKENINYNSNTETIEDSNLKELNNELKNNRIRKLENVDDGFKKIRIYVDKTYISKNIENHETYEKVIYSLEKCVKSIEELIKVKQLDKIQFSNEDIIKLGLTNNDINPNLLETGEGISTDLVIFPKFEQIQQNTKLKLAIGKPLIFHSVLKRPIGAILSIHKSFPDIRNSENYFESIIIHQLTHILGFMYDVFDRFDIGFSNVIKTDRETRTNETKKFVISPKVVEYAKKYFNCSTVSGVELEDSGGYDDYINSHWEARILLGEYMNSEVHTPEQAISGFTLALLEDSGWYKANYYTGGLMRFGKHQGCAFINEDCEVNDHSKNKFKNDLFVISNLQDIFKTTCTSGRQSRSYIISNSKLSRGNVQAGKEIADDCFVSDLNIDEEQSSYYVGSCNKGNGEYGKMIYYNNQYHENNGNIPENFGEKISNNSFCVLSSAVPLSLKNEDINKFNAYDGINHPMCYPMFCSSKSLTIQIYNQYIVCPREGGIIEIKGNYKGFIYCPDYNLICTGTVMCNDMFDCIAKHSFEKDDIYEYDYIIKTSQEKIRDENLNQDDISIGYELSNEDNGKCPQYCSQCKENRKCFICKENYILIGVKEGDDNPIKCMKISELGDNYYKNDEENTYYLCADNCLSCSGKDQCDNCGEMFKLNSDNSGCEEIIPNCKKLDSNNEKCEECKDNFYFLDDDKYHCYNDTIDKEKYLTEDDGKTFISCSKAIENCDKCKNKSSCIECKVGFYLLDDDKLNCHNDSLDIDKYFTEDEGKTFISCSKAIENCDKCRNKSICLECNDGYLYNQNNLTCMSSISSCKIYDNNYEYCQECEDGFYLLDDDKLNCHNDSLDKDKYFSEDEGKTYISCKKAITNCEKCEERNKCLACNVGYKLNSESFLCENIISNCKQYDTNYQKCEECEHDYYLLDDDKLHCYNQSLDPDKYFTEDEGKTYISCEKNINNCEKCKERNKCLECNVGYKLNSESSSCDEIVSFCQKYDSNYQNCEECIEGFYFLNDDRLKCFNDTLDKEHYFTEDEGKSFISCENAIANCEKCKGRRECLYCKDGYFFNDKNLTCVKILFISSCKNYSTNHEYCEECEEGFYLLDDDKSNCYNDTLDKDKYFTEDGGKSYVSCEKAITGCDKCEERKKCKQCKENYELSINGENCIFFEFNNECNINIHYIEEEDLNFLEKENINYLTEIYEKENKYNVGQVEYYINKKNNYTVTIYTLDNCTKDLLKIGAFSLNTTNILENYNREKLIICFITYDFKNYISFFENNEEVDIKNYVSRNILKYNIENNYTNELNDQYSPLLVEKIKEQNIDIFSPKNINLDDKCKSFELGGIDIPIELREKIFFNSHGRQEFLCTDMNCEIFTNDKQSSISTCNCNINNDFNYLFADNKESNKINVELEIEVKIVDYVLCTFKNINTRTLITNFSFFLTIFCLLVEIICFIIFLSLKQNLNFQKYIKSTTLKPYNQETQENKKILFSEDIQKHTLSEDNSIGNPPHKNLIKYKYKWLNKPKVLNLDNSHDEDLDIQSRDEANIENELKRKIKIFPFIEDNSITNSSYLDESLYDTKTEMSKNKITIPVGEEKLHIKNNIKVDQPTAIKTGALPQIISREENARKKIRLHSIKNTTEGTTNSKAPNKSIEEKVIKKPIEIYCDVVCIKQPLINLFYCPNNLDRESFIPISMKIIRFIFLILLNIFINCIFLNQNYFKEKYNYFNDKYNLAHKAEKDFQISTNDKLEYILKHCIINILISFAICLIVQLIIGLFFFNTKKKIDNLIEFNKIMQMKNDNKVLKKIKCLFIVYFVINFILIIVFCIFIIGFNIMNNNSEIDLFLPSIITFIILQLIPFLISIFITIIMYLGLKNDNKKMINIGKSFLF